MSAPWDVIVIGAGPAGSMAAIASARAGLRTLLVDRASFPRAKVCGGCISPRGLELLRASGVRVPMVEVGGIVVWSGGRAASVRTRPGAVVERSALDAALADAAVMAGATFVDSCSASIEASDSACAEAIVRVRAHISTSGDERALDARVGICADGLQGRSLERVPGFASNVWPRSRMGLGMIAERSTLDGLGLSERDVTMMIAPRGYVGFARMHDGRWDVAAAVDRELLEASGGPELAISRIMVAACADDGLAKRLGSLQGWKGTPLLTRTRPRVEGPRILVAGDAASYAEPFTGEGMTWAMESGWRAGECAAAIARGTHVAGSYEAWWRDRVVTQQRRTLRLAKALRVPALVTAGVLAAGVSQTVGRVLSRFAGSWRATSTARSHEQTSQGRLA